MVEVTTISICFVFIFRQGLVHYSQDPNVLTGNHSFKMDLRCMILNLAITLKHHCIHYS